MEALQGAISAAKLLGVNTTDKDLQKAVESRPNMNDGKAVWEDWTYTKLIPSIKNAITSQQDTDDKRAKQIISMLDTIVSDDKKTKEVKKTPSCGTDYIIIDQEAVWRNRNIRLKGKRLTKRQR